MKGGVCLWLSRRLSLSTLLYVSVVAAAQAQDHAIADGDGNGAPVDAQHLQQRQCTALAQSPLTTQSVARHALLQRLESARAQCIGHPPFLAALGGLWLEEGEPGRALIWLERSLLLDPENLGAQADHALALAALGEGDALRGLLQFWKGRTDVPAALVLRLTSPTLALAPPRANGNATGTAQSNGRWASYREATTLLGYESNLDHSPKLAEITLTVPDGPLALPLLNPLTPRRGPAVLAELSWQLAGSPEAGRVWRSGVHVGVRSAPSESKADWHNIQWAASGSQRFGPWRGQLELAATWIGGPLNEPYRLLRASATGERDALGCMLRFAIDAERRTQQTTSSLDGRTLSGLWSAQCPIPTVKAWSWGLAVRTSLDQARDANRPGGDQRLSSLGTRVVGGLPNGMRVEAALRFSRVRDVLGYSPLLENNAQRQLNQTQFSLELARPLRWLPGTGAEALLQVQAVRQGSNLSIFRYSAISTYGGLRWSW